MRHTAVRVAWWSATGLGLLGVALYFAAAIVHVGPLNPAKLHAGDRAADVLSPYFDQNWSLFAPDPISTERGILIRARDNDQDVVTEWYDATTEANAASRSRLLLSPRTSRIVSNGLSMYLSPDPYRAELLERAEEEGVELDESAFELTPEEQEYRANAVELLVRYASSVALDRWGTEIDDVQVRIMVHEFPPYSERERWDSIGEIQTEDLPWQSIVEEVERS